MHKGTQVSFKDLFAVTTVSALWAMYVAGAGVLVLKNFLPLMVFVNVLFVVRILDRPISYLHACKIISFRLVGCVVLFVTMEAAILLFTALLSCLAFDFSPRSLICTRQFFEFSLVYLLLWSLWISATTILYAMIMPSHGTANLLPQLCAFKAFCRLDSICIAFISSHLLLFLFVFCWLPYIRTLENLHFLLLTCGNWSFGLIWIAEKLYRRQKKEIVLPAGQLVACFLHVQSTL